MENKGQRSHLHNFSIFLFLTFTLLTTGLTANAAQVVVIPLISSNTSNTSSISPDNVVQLGASIAPNVTSDVISISPTASNGGVYTVPAGKYLVLTSITIFPDSPGAGNISMQLIQNSAIRSYWVVPNAQPTTLPLGPGMLIGSGYSLKIKNWASSPGSIRVSLYGYVTN